MLIPFWSPSILTGKTDADTAGQKAPGELTAEQEAISRKRRGVTALEYLVMLSLIIVVVILAVQHLGTTARGLFSNSAKATTTGTTGS